MMYARFYVVLRLYVCNSLCLPEECKATLSHVHSCPLFWQIWAGESNCEIFHIFGRIDIKILDHSSEKFSIFSIRIGFLYQTNAGHRGKLPHVHLSTLVPKVDGEGNKCHSYEPSAAPFMLLHFWCIFKIGMSDDVTIGLRQLASSAIFANFYCFRIQNEHFIQVI